MNKFLLIISILFFCINTSSFAQNEEGFEFHRPNKKRYKIKFTNYNNLIIIKIKLNGQPLNFLLDTGVDKTVLFGLKDDQNQIKNQSEKIMIKGVSGQKQTYAYKVENNTLEIGKLKDSAHDVYAIFDQSFNISDKIGYQIQGIIGYDFFKNLVVKINYMRNHLKIYNPNTFNKSLNSYEVKNLRLFKQKPYIKTQLKQDDKWQDYVFLLDSGSGDAIWIKSKNETQIPDDNFDDILGYGFADIIRGKRAKADAFKLGKYIMEKPKIAYPDTLAYEGVNFTEDSGVIGSEIMRRYHWYFDYTDSKVYFKKNNNFSDDFNYDMSGLILKYDGYQSIAHYQNVFPQAKAKNDNSAGYNKVEMQSKLVVEFRPILKVGAVRYNSPAYEAGFIEGDEIVKISGRKSYRYDFEEINKILSSEEGRQINFIIQRGGKKYKKSLLLKSRLSE